VHIGVVVTAVNSHGAVWRTRKLAKLAARALRSVEVCSAALRAVVAGGGLEARERLKFPLLAVWDGAGLQSHARQVRFLEGAPCTTATEVACTDQRNLCF
jgi:hypothetical protein